MPEGWPPERLAALHAASFTLPRPWSAAEFAALLSAPQTFLLAESTGFLVGRAVAGEAELLTLAVEPAARRAGCGRRLLARFEAEARARGAERAFLEVAAGNRAARALYAGAGWREAGLRRGYYAAPGGAAVDAVVMVRDLRAG